MIRYGILVQDAFNRTLWTRYLIGAKVCALSEIGYLVKPELSDDDSGCEAFTECCQWLTHLLHPRGDGQAAQKVVVLTDLCGGSLGSPLELDPLSTSNSGRMILGMLILSFPEVHWALAGMSTLGRQCGLWIAAHELPISPPRSTQRSVNGKVPLNAIDLSRIGLTTLFDGAGLRNIVREAIRKHHGKKEIPTRTWCALSLDDEVNYALLHAYVAYRFGFRAIPISTYTLAQGLLGQEAAAVRAIELNLQVVFEDIFLALPGGPQGLSDLSIQRRKALPGLEDPPHRLLVTLGRREPQEPEKWARNLAYVASQRENGKNIRIVTKPHSGIFAFWKKASMDARLRWVSIHGRPWRGTGEGFAWPLAGCGESNDRMDHSAPGAIELVAQSLVERAQRMLPQVRTVEDAVVGAVLATDALELLAGKMPTTSLDALSLKHQFEVLIEGKFSGTEYDLDLQPRLDEIAQETDRLCKGFHPKSRRRAALSAEIKILYSLLVIFRANAQYDAEQSSMNRIRRLRGSLWIGEGKTRFVLIPVIRYVELLLSSFATFLIAIGVWIVALTFLYVWAGAGHSWTIAFEDALTSFFSIGGPFHEEASNKFPLTTGYVSIVCLAIISGFVHLGILVSHLYSLITRK